MLPMLLSFRCREALDSVARHFGVKYRVSRVIHAPPLVTIVRVAVIVSITMSAKSGTKGPWRHSTLRTNVTLQLPTNPPTPALTWCLVAMWSESVEIVIKVKLEHLHQGAKHTSFHIPWMKVTVTFSMDKYNFWLEHWTKQQSRCDYIQWGGV